MADYLSNYTGQEIDQKLGEVDNKVNKADIVDDAARGDTETPASSRLMSEAYKKLESLQSFQDNKVLRIDEGDQTVNGKKTFAAVTAFNKGLTVPKDQVISITDKAKEATDAVNLAMLRDHGLSVDDSAGKGLTIRALSTGYLALTVDFTTLDPAPGNTVPAFVPVATSTGNYKLSYDDFIAGITATDAFQGKLDKSVYDTKMSQLDTAVSNRVLISSYNADLAATNSALGNRVLTSNYNTKMSQLDASLSNKVEVSSYNTAIAGLNSAVSTKVEQTVFDTAIAGKVGYAQDGQVSINGNNTTSTVVTLPKANCIQLLVSTALADGVTDLYEIFMNNTTLISTTQRIKNTSGTAPATFAATVTSGNINLICSNTATGAMTVRYKILANF
ncbi:hypothetical protein HWB57_gp154 [Erwinia phage vB_EamM-Bue1]|uniref:Tail fiber protein n=1 Tax=Erwinia phage vB_EamM-Bue1 TaxID=2099338 RepID=A0A2P1JUF7_9CAUD|nr:hypothetical protein HWB57_gp154 [Erwinia phage vB_EamM-Bue1]AVO22991.1 hypothetical protein [Erwinia phage vB_EamM-Bue1]